MTNEMLNEIIENMAEEIETAIAAENIAREDAHWVGDSVAERAHEERDQRVDEEEYQYQRDDECRPEPEVWLPLDPYPSFIHCESPP